MSGFNLHSGPKHSGTGPDLLGMVLPPELILKLGPEVDRLCSGGTGRFQPVTEVGDNNLVQLETMDGKPLKTKTPYASVKPLRMRSQAGRPTKTPVDPPAESVHSDDLELHSSVSEEDLLKACAALLNRRVEDFRAMVLGQHTWLDDKAIDHAQALLKAQHANMGGLHTTTSLALLSTVPTPAQGFVQILNVSANHWVTSAVRGEDPSMVDYHQAAMRTHLFASFQAGILTPFPSTARGPTAKAVHAIEVDVHCLCRRTIRFGIMVGGG
ncbi:hypothetical protein SKAU_G00385850 [Synaphobranchus kaupii]|uniref:Uncharacterized protein n=1 Tax=Synaphobranchus kaupii TaxID=118154 RepID=A0A9Q1IEA3_SYNKA|nr:hypothetical protein SKAU_G00385850 [Synaphobranchus kaupii]